MTERLVGAAIGAAMAVGVVTGGMIGVFVYGDLLTAVVFGLALGAILVGLVLVFASLSTPS